MTAQTLTNDAGGRIYTRALGKLGRAARHQAITVVALAILVAFAVITVVGRRLAPLSPSDQHLTDRLLPPGSVTVVGRHLFGTDALGRDMWSMILAGANSIVIQALLAVLIGAAMGLLLGMVCGYRGGRFGDALVLLTNLQMSFPFFLLALAVVGILGASFWLVVLVVALASWVQIARVVYLEARDICQQEYILAVRVMRGSSARILFRHILPNVMPSTLVLGGLSFGHAIVIISGLGFIGLSAPSSSPGWGEILNDGRGYMGSAWWLTVVPGVAIFLLVLSVNVLSEALRDRLVHQ